MYSATKYYTTKGQIESGKSKTYSAHSTGAYNSLSLVEKIVAQDIAAEGKSKLVQPDSARVLSHVVFTHHVDGMPKTIKRDDYI